MVQRAWKAVSGGGTSGTPGHGRCWARAALLVIAAGFLLAAAPYLVRGTSDAGESGESVYRFHVLAHSDRDADQAVKAAVSSALVEYLAHHLPGSSWAGPEDVAAWMTAHGRGLEDTATAVLASAGMNYGVEVATGDFWFGPRSLSGRYYPPGRYPATLVVLGDGQGRNWWCVVFPAFCSAGVLDADGAVPALTGTPPAPPQYRSALLEWLRREHPDLFADLHPNLLEPDLAESRPESAAVAEGAAAIPAVWRLWLRTGGWSGSGSPSPEQAPSP